MIINSSSVIDRSCLFHWFISVVVDIFQWFRCRYYERLQILQILIQNQFRSCLFIKTVFNINKIIPFSTFIIFTKWSISMLNTIYKIKLLNIQFCNPQKSRLYFFWNLYSKKKRFEVVFNYYWTTGLNNSQVERYLANLWIRVMEISDTKYRNRAKLSSKLHWSVSRVKILLYDSQ